MGRNTPQTNRPSRTVANQKLAEGLIKHQALLNQLVVNGVQLTTPQVVSKLGEIIAIANSAVTAHATWQAAVQADLTEIASTATFVAGIRQAILVAFHGQVDVLADFGLTTRKSVVRSPEQKQAAAAKAKATRAARHTLGKKQKAAITGASAAAAAAASPPAHVPAATQPAAPAAPASPSPTPQQ